jgi:UDP-N-acetylglucosamine--N-acetylmuramyl-(pentapeptide) pyrophosphoryl-undecaprenol N-acetylglucosamine transferase
MATPRPEKAAEHSRLKICLAASGGGHLRQLLDLETVWSKHDAFFLTEDTALGRSLSEKVPTHFVPHFAWGQARQGSSGRMLLGAWDAMRTTWAVLSRERPDVVISTGAGAMIFAIILGRFLKAHVVVVESFARFESPSLFGRIAAPFAHDMVVQSARLSARYPSARVFDPFKILQTQPRPKSDLLFATVGATLPFERLIEAVAKCRMRGQLPGRVVVQTGVGAKLPAGLEGDGVEVVETLPFETVKSLLSEARLVVCHGGTGSLVTALREGCHVIAMPRLARLGEHYDDHQAEIVGAFEARGLVQSAANADEIAEAIRRADGRAPVFATTDPEGLRDFLSQLFSRIMKDATSRGRT